MGKKKDCFGEEDYVCMTPGCPYANDCVREVWRKRLERTILRKQSAAPAPKRSRSRLTVNG